MKKNLHGYGIYDKMSVARKIMQYSWTLVPHLRKGGFPIRVCRRKTRRKKDERNFYEAVT